MDLDLDAVADELYGLRPEDFTAARDTRAAAARTAGDRALAEQIGQLRRPSLSAWASNLLVREQPDQIEPLLRLGEALRQAHQDLDGAQLRTLSRQQRALIGALSRQAGQLAARAGHPISEDAQREIESTLHTVLADPEAAREWAKGRLVRPLTATVGFPAASPPAKPRAAPAAKPAPADEQRRERLARARKGAKEADQELRAREKEAAAATRDADKTRKLAEKLQRHMDELAAELKRVRVEHEQARTAEHKAREDVRRTERRVREAGRHAETAAAKVERAG
ncbi:hypothetical protein [Streptomyces sp. GESEQ-35]|uniref:hypothetical protein n=1 Tax=Streptomyces sp. GESEQ-35 TaxID=2812657 RepID=UPI001FF3E1B3|nr:hypothetical protein [Streptomyces sp. GESEQ-35]